MLLLQSASSGSLRAPRVSLVSHTNPKTKWLVAGKATNLFEKGHVKEKSPIKHGVSAAMRQPNSALAFRFRTSSTDHLPSYPPPAFQPLLLNPQPQYVDYSNIGLKPNTVPLEGLGYSKYRPSIPSASGFTSQYGPNDIDADSSPYNYYGSSSASNYRQSSANTETLDQARRFGGLFDPDALAQGKPNEKATEDPDRDMGNYPLTSPQGLPYSYMPPSGAFLMNTGYGEASTGGLPGGDALSATSSENDAMPGTGKGSSQASSTPSKTMFLETLTKRAPVQQENSLSSLSPGNTMPGVTPFVKNPNILIPNLMQEESVDDLTGQQFLSKPSTLDNVNMYKSPLPSWPTIENPQAMPQNMNPARPDYDLSY